MAVDAKFEGKNVQSADTGGQLGGKNGRASPILDRGMGVRTREVSEADDRQRAGSLYRGNNAGDGRPGQNQSGSVGSDDGTGADGEVRTTGGIGSAGVEFAGPHVLADVEGIPQRDGGVLLRGGLGEGRGTEGGVRRGWFYDPDRENPQPRGAKAKLRANIEAIETLVSLERTGAVATAENARKLAAYSGWGSLSQFFDPTALYARDLLSQGRGHFVSTYQRKALEQWEAAYGEVWAKLSSLLTHEDLEQARQSTLNAHYTSPSVCKALWSVAERLGFSGGSVFEPGMGTGLIQAACPKHLRDKVAFTGVELDGVTARIAKQLFPDDDVRRGDVREVTAEGQYDLVLGNVPFHENAVHDPSLVQELNLHNYCLAKGIQALKPGGVLVAVTSRHTMDSQMAQRDFLAKKGDFIGAIRLPHSTFRANAGTDVVTDIVIVRRPDGRKVCDLPRWQLAEELLTPTEMDVKLGRAIKPIKRNEYFATRPEMLIGTETLEKSSQFAEKDYRVECDLRELDERIEKAIATLPRNVLTAGRDVSPQARSVETETMEEGAYVIDASGNVRYFEDGAYKVPSWLRDGTGGRLSESEKVSAAQSYIGLRDQYRQVLRMQADPQVIEEDLDEARAALSRMYDTHTDRWGALNARKPALRFLADDGHYFSVLGLENVAITKTSAGTVYETSKAPIFFERTVAPTVEPNHAGTIEDALTLSLSWRAKIDTEYIAKLLGRSWNDIRGELLEKSLVFLNPDNGELEIREKYLSGNVRLKRDIAQSFVDRGEERYLRNVEALDQVIPAWIPIEKIEPKLGVNWIPTGVIEDFADRKMGLVVSVGYMAAIDKWHVQVKRGKSGVRNVSDYGTSKLRGDEIFEKLLNLKSLKVYDYIEMPGEATVKVFDPVGTAEAEEKARTIQDDFRTYVRSVGDADRDRIERQFNYSLNSHHLADYDGGHLLMPGLSKKFRRDPQQLRAVWRFLTEGNGLMAHQVGSGKTVIQIEMAMEARRLGLYRKPMLVVDNATVMQFSQTFREAYPHSKILVGNPENFSPDKRCQFLSRCASGDWDAIIMPHSSFDQISSSPTAIKRFYDEQIAELKGALFFSKGQDDRVTTKQLAAAIDRLRKKRAKVLDALEERQDKTLYWEELGIDMLMVDEAHKFKKVPFVSKMGTVRGIDTTESQRALNLYLKVRDVQQKNQGYKGVILATGTPVTNTLAEAWTMVRLASPHLLKDFGVDSFDQFAASFGEVVTQPELNEANGKWRLVSRFAKFKHGGSLVQFIRASWDVYMPDAFKRVERPGVPKLKGDGPTAVVVPLSVPNRAINDWMMRVYSEYESKGDKRPYSYVPIMLIQVGQAAALDPRLILPSVLDEGGLKVDAVVENVVRVYKECAERKGTQLVFADRYRPMNIAKMESLARGDFDRFELEEDGDQEAVAVPDVNEGGFNLYRELKGKLLQAGLAESEVVILNEEVDNIKGDKAKAMFDRVNSGDIRVLIGSTATMGTGVNVQTRLAALHEMDPPRFLTPADEEQRHGRIIRGGNTNAEVEIFQYGMERTADAGIYHRIETKARFIKQVLCGVGDLDQFEDPASQVTQSLAELKAKLTGDIRVLEHVTLKEEVRQLKLQREGFFRQIGNKRALLHKNQNAISRINTYEIPRAEAFQQTANGPLANLLSKLSEEGAEFSVTHAGRTASIRNDQLKEVLDIMFQKASQDANERDISFRIDEVELKLRCYGFVTKAMNYSLVAFDDTNRVLHSANVQNPTGLLRSLSTLQERSSALRAELAQELNECETNCISLQCELGNTAWPGESNYSEKAKQLSLLETELLTHSSEDTNGHTEGLQSAEKTWEDVSKEEIDVDHESADRVTTVSGDQGVRSLSGQGVRI
jgi:N12 class adenine-specific DNA methylase